MTGQQMRTRRVGSCAVIALAAWSVSACTSVGVAGGPARPASVQDTTDRVAQVTGLAGPEAVRYDPDQDVWFVANFGESGEEQRDGNGFISRVAADGAVETLRFMTGTAGAPLHMPRGMAIRGDTLFVADVDGVHAFDRRSGAHLRFVDMSAHEPGFINDLAFDGGGTLYATDTGRGRVYRLAGRSVTVGVEDPRTGPPNGIIWDASRSAFLLAPWDGEQTLRAWSPQSGAFTDIATLPGGNFDGIEVIADGILVASQVDSTLYLLDASTARALVRVPGRPADIGFDTRRNRVAVPYIALNRVDIWELP